MAMGTQSKAGIDCDLWQCRLSASHLMSDDVLLKMVCGRMIYLLPNLTYLKFHMSFETFLPKAICNSSHTPLTNNEESVRNSLHKFLACDVVSWYTVTRVFNDNINCPAGAKAFTNKWGAPGSQKDGISHRVSYWIGSERVRDWGGTFLKHCIVYLDFRLQLSVRILNFSSPSRTF